MNTAHAVFSVLLWGNEVNTYNITDYVLAAQTWESIFCLPSSKAAVASHEFLSIQCRSTAVYFHLSTTAPLHFGE